jgi:hypothetical protein
MLKDLLGSEKRVGDILGSRAPGAVPITRATRG